MPPATHLRFFALSTAMLRGVLSFAAQSAPVLIDTPEREDHFGQDIRVRNFGDPFFRGMRYRALLGTLGLPR